MLFTLNALCKIDSSRQQENNYEIKNYRGYISKQGSIMTLWLLEAFQLKLWTTLVQAHLCRGGCLNRISRPPSQVKESKRVHYKWSIVKAVPKMLGRPLLGSMNSLTFETAKNETFGSRSERRIQSAEFVSYKRAHGKSHCNQTQPQSAGNIQLLKFQLIFE